MTDNITDIFSENNENDNENESNGSSGSQNEQIKEYGTVTPAGKSPIYCLTVIGQIEGHYLCPSNSKTTKYEHIIPQLVAAEEDDSVEGLLMILNTVGGDVEAGLALSEMIAGMTKPVVSLVLGGGHSIGVPLAVSARHSFIVPSATMTVHPVRMTGLVVGVPQTYSYFERMQDRIVRFVCSHSRIAEDDMRKMLHNTAELATDIGTVLEGQEAVDCGLIDDVGSLSDALRCLYDMIGSDSQDSSHDCCCGEGCNCSG